MYSYSTWCGTDCSCDGSRAFDLCFTASSWVCGIRFPPPPLVRFFFSRLTDIYMMMDRVHAPAERPDTMDASTSTGTSASPLGCVPHQLRGQMYQWKTQIVEGEAFERCTGCSDYVSVLLLFPQ